MLITIYDDRPRDFVGVELAVASLQRHLTGSRIRLVRPGITAAERGWVDRFPSVEVVDRGFADTGWDAKPAVLLDALDHDDDVVWWDSDMVATSDLSQLLPPQPPAALVAAEETFWGQEQGTGHRSRAWRLGTARLLPTTVNTGLLRVGPRHRRLLEAWRDLLRDDRYRRAQLTPWQQRPLHLLGDQEVLTALLESPRFAAEPVRLLRRGVGIAQCFGPAGFTVAERLASGLRGSSPPVVHAMGPKPWHRLPWPDGKRLPRPGRAGDWRVLFERLHAQLSPYTVAASRFRDQLDGDTRWLGPAPTWVSLVRVGSGSGGPAAPEFGLAVVDSLVRRARRRLGVARFPLTDAPTGDSATRAVSGRRVLTTMRSESDGAWTSATEYVPPPHRSTVAWAVRFALRARRRDAVILRGTSGATERYRDLLGALAMRALAPRTTVVMSDATIEPGSRTIGTSPVRARLASQAARLLVRGVDSPTVTWCVLSTAEVERFPRTWGPLRGRVVFTAFTHTLTGGEPNPAQPVRPRLFSGGDSLRDYDLLASAVDGLDVEVTVATRAWRPADPPAGLTARTTSHEEFLESMASSRAVVLCLEEAVRSTGQATYLNAMALGRPVLVTDSDGVRDHIDDGVTGVVMEPTVAGVRAAITDVLDPGRRDHYDRMGERARALARERFSPAAYRARLVEIARGPGAAR